MARKAKKTKFEAATRFVRITPSDKRELEKWAKVYGEPVTRVLRDAINSYVGKTIEYERR